MVLFWELGPFMMVSVWACVCVVDNQRCKRSNRVILLGFLGQWEIMILRLKYIRSKPLMFGDCFEGHLIVEEILEMPSLGQQRNLFLNGELPLLLTKLGLGGTNGGKFLQYGLGRQMYMQIR